MAAPSSVLRIADRETSYRVPPHNVEAEQALLGAILVNNDAYFRVSDFLEPAHFSEELHRRIYDILQQLIRAGKLATPVTLKSFVGEQDLGGMTVPQYLARLAAEATTVINAEAYGRTIYDLAMRRQLINIGEDMVNVAYDAPVDLAPRNQIEDAERRLFELAALVMPATVGHVQAISEHGERMPAKSTYFYPKLLSGLVFNPLE